MNARSRTSWYECPVYVAMRRFSATVRFGKMPRPSGMRHTPARASASGAAPVTSRPQRNMPPEVGTIWPDATASVVDLPGAVRPEQREHLARAQLEVDAVQHVDRARSRRAPP